MTVRTQDAYEVASSEGETSTPLSPLSVHMEKWTEMADGKNRDQIYDLAGMAPQRFSKSTSSTRTQREQQLEEELNLIKVEMTDLRSQISSVNDIKAQLAILNEIVRTMQQGPPPGTTSFPPLTAAIPFPTAGFAPYA